MSVNTIGTEGFEQSGPPSWGSDSSGLDTLEVPYQGAAGLLASFVAALTINSGSTFSATMLLAGWTTDGDRQFPTVTLSYVGNRGSGSFVQVGLERWSSDESGLETLAIVMRGSHGNLATFIAGLAIGDAHVLHASMKLVDWSTDSSNQYPSVALAYQGQHAGPSFEIVGVPRWGQQRDGMKTLALTMRGDVMELADYIASLEVGQESILDSAMLLDSWGTDGGFQFPTVSLNYIGRDGFEQIGSVRWSPNGWELDRLTEPWQGAASGLAAFIAGLGMWQGSGTDINMFLEDWTSNGDPLYPIVDLVFMGKKGGGLPPERYRESQGIQEAQYVSFGYTDTDGLRITITYTAPSANAVKWSRTPLVIDSIGAATPDDCAVIAFTAEAFGSYVGIIPTTFAEALAYFNQFISSTGDNEEVVPGEYYRGTQTKQASLRSSAF